MKIPTLLLLSVLIPLAAKAAEPPVKKVLIIGDSISKHGPAKALGWDGDWGMAASSEDKDYVHLFLARLAASQGGEAPELLLGGGGGGALADKLPALGNFKAFGADLAIVQMGENDNKEVNEAGFQQPYEQILQAIKEGNPKARILCAGVWSPPNGSPVKDAMIKKACAKYGAVFVSLAAANAQPANLAGSEKRFTHAGVNWHPGDLGMQAYADALWLGWTNPQAASGPASAPADDVEPLILSEAWNGKSDIKWKPVPTEDQGMLMMTSDSAEGLVQTATVLPIERCAGRRLLFETRVRGENISDKPEPYNGVKLMLILLNAEGQLEYPQVDLPVGSFDWQDVSWICSIPDNIVSAKLLLGLERVTGTVWFEPLKVSFAD